MQEDVDTCRICSAPAEPNQPLYYPCKCSGTIRYIHQDCLTTWLQHSNKRHCDVCKHPYKFTKVYAPNMPDKLPVLLFLRRLIRQVGHGIVLCLRAILVTSVWLILLPYCTIWTWRFYFWLGDQLAWRIYAGPRPAVVTKPHPNITEAARAVLDNVPSDIFTGQIIACLIVLVFLAVFLLREWIAQNARPGIFDEGEGQAVDADGAPLVNVEPVLDEPLLEVQPDHQELDQHWDRPPAAHVGFEDATQAWAEHVAQIGGADPPIIEPDHGIASTSAIQTQHTHNSVIFRRKSLPEDALRREQLRRPRGLRRISGGGFASTSASGDFVAFDSEPEDEQQSGHQHKRRRPSPAPHPRFRPQTLPHSRPGPSRTVHGAVRTPRRRVTPTGLGGIIDDEFNATMSAKEIHDAAQRDLGDAMWKRGYGEATQKELEDGANDGDVEDELGSGKEVDKGKGKAPANGPIYRFGSLPSTVDRPSTLFDKPGKSEHPFSFESPPFKPSEGTLFKPLDSANFQPAQGVRFTFTAPVITEESPSPEPLNTYASSPADFKLKFSSSSGLDDSSWAESDFNQLPTPFQGQEAQPTSNDPVPHSADEQKDEALPTTPQQFHLPLSAPSSSASASASRPQLPPTTSGFSSPLKRPTLPSSAQPSPKAEFPGGPASPGVALYQPPEELLDGYFPPALREKLDADMQAPQGSAAAGPLGPEEEDEDEWEDYDSTDEARRKEMNKFFAEPNEDAELRAIEQRMIDELRELDQELIDKGATRLDAPRMAARQLPLPDQMDGPIQDIGGDVVEDREAGILGDAADDTDVQEDEDEERPPAEQDVAPVAGEEPVEDPMAEEDMDGALEAIGMRGPLQAMFQNAALMVVILDTTIGVGIWTPYTIGKTVALLALSPPRALYLLNLPIRVVRFITDPFVDLFLLLVRQLVAPVSVNAIHAALLPLEFTLQMIWRGFTTVLRPFVTKEKLDAFALGLAKQVIGNPKPAVPSPTSATAASDVPKMLQQAANLLRNSSLWSGSASSEATAVAVETPVAIPTFVQHLIPAEVNPTVFKTQISGLGKAFANAWVSMAHNDDAHDRVWSVVLGYAVAGIVAGLYLNSVTVDGVRGAGRAVRNVIRQQLVIIKVAFFIIIELAAFPLGCGILLDLVSLPMFPNATIATRLAFFDYAPVTSTFYHWVVGTLFMYQFAVLLSSCREVMRPGAIWFIKDPQDPNYHPIRDILERPTFSQIRKLLTSAFMYAIVISGGVGAVVGLLYLSHVAILPLRWNMREPLSEIPIDLLFIHIVLPPTLRYFRPKRILRVLLSAWWRYAARQLRLTSYMFGTMPRDEMFPDPDWQWSALLETRVDDNDIRPTPEELAREEPPPSLGVTNGGFRRVPATDNVVRVPNRRTVVVTDERGIPLDDESRETMQLQDEELSKAHRDPAQDFLVIYAPPYFRERLILFNLLLWLTLATVVALSIGAPIKIGRLVISLFTPREVHDGYAFAIGFYCCWTFAFIRLLLAREKKRWKKHLGSTAVPASFPYKSAIQKSVRWLVRILWMVLTLGVILPILLALVVDLYIVWPIRLWASHNTMVPVFRVAESWAIGLIYAKIALRTQRLQPTNDYTAAWATIKRAGWLRPDPWAATRDFFLPVCGGLLGMIFLPVAIVLSAKAAFPSLEMDDKYLFHTVYPGLFILASWGQLFIAISKLFSSWAQSIRDSEFLVELRVRNLEKPDRSEKEKNAVARAANLPPPAAGRRPEGQPPAIVDIDDAASDATTVPIA